MAARSEDAQRAHQRAVLMPGDEDQACLARRTELNSDRVPREDNEPRVVLGVVGNAAPEDHELVCRRRLGRADGDQGGVSRRVYQPHRRTSVELQNL